MRSLICRRWAVIFLINHINFYILPNVVGLLTYLPRHRTAECRDTARRRIFFFFSLKKVFFFTILFNFISSYFVVLLVFFFPSVLLFFVQSMGWGLVEFHSTLGKMKRKSINNRSCSFTFCRATATTTTKRKL